MILLAGITVTILAGLLTVIITPPINKFLYSKGYTGTDVHKKHCPQIPEFGGIAPVIATLAAMIISLIIQERTQIVTLTAIVATISLIALIGIIDDLKEIRQRLKIVLCAFAGIPLWFAVQDTTLGFFLLGEIDLGVLYYLFIVLTVTTSANLSNLLAGFNGLETGLGIVSASTLIIIVGLSGEITSILLILPFLAALVGFLPFNWYPAKSFPGDTLTLTIGAALASLAILTKTEFYLAILFIPHFVDFFLKIFVGFKGRAIYGNTTINTDGTLKPAAYPALAHKLLQRTPMTEKRLVTTLILFEILIAILAIILAVFQYYYGF